MRVRFQWVYLLCTVFLATACGPEDSTLEIPKAPDMSNILAAYDTPSAELNEKTIQRILESFQQWQEYRNLVCGTETCESGLFCSICPEMADLDSLLTSAITQESTDEEDDVSLEGFESREGALESLEQAEGTQFNGDGYIRATRPCLGDNNASMTLTLTASQNGLNPVVWGSIDGCDINFSGNKATVYLNFELNLGAQTEPVAFSAEGLENLPAIVLRLKGKLETSEDSYEMELDLKSLLNKAEVQLRIPVDGQHVLFYFKQVEDAVDYGFDAVNGRWSCDFSLDPTNFFTTGNQVECTHSSTETTLSYTF